jgi:Peptidase family M50
VKQSMRLGRIGGVTVGAHWSVGLILVIIAEVLAVSVLPAAWSRHEAPAVYWTVAIVAAVVFLASLLAHEVAHALVAMHSGVNARSITLWMLGGVTEFDAEPPSAGADFRIALAGPVASQAAGAVCYGVGAAIHAADGPAIVADAAVWLALMNGILGCSICFPARRWMAAGCCGRCCGGAMATGSGPSRQRPGPGRSSARSSSRGVRGGAGRQLPRRPVACADRVVSHQRSNGGKAGCHRPDRLGRRAGRRGHDSAPGSGLGLGQRGGVHRGSGAVPAGRVPGGRPGRRARRDRADRPDGPYPGTGAARPAAGAGNAARPARLPGRPANPAARLASRVPLGGQVAAVVLPGAR